MWDDWYRTMNITQWNIPKGFSLPVVDGIYKWQWRIHKVNRGTMVESFVILQKEHRAIHITPPGKLER